MVEATPAFMDALNNRHDSTVEESSR